MKIAIIGASGVLGQSVIPMLLNDNHEVLALSPHPEKSAKLYGDAVSTAYGNLLDDNAEAHLSEVLSGYDAVLNLATAIPSDFTAPGAWEDNTRLRTEGAGRLLRAAINAGVRQYVQQSVTLFYPDMGEQWIDEDTPLDEDGNGGPVAVMERAVRAVDPAVLRWSLLRGAWFIGQNTFEEDTIAALKAGQQKIPGEGKAYAAYVRVEDMARAVKLALDKDVAGVTLNISAEPIRQGDYLKRLAAYINAPEPAYDKYAIEEASQRVSNQRAKEVLGWEPTHSLMPDYLAEVSAQ